jgi:DNA-binding response OmpR family regulator
MKILLIEDEPELRKLIKQFIQQKELTENASRETQTPLTIKKKIWDCQCNHHV